MYITKASEMRKVTKNSFSSVVCSDEFDVAVKINQAANNSDNCITVILSMTEREANAILRELKDKGYKVRWTEYPSTGNGIEIDWGE